MKTWIKFMVGALSSTGILSAAHAAYGPGNPASASAVPAGYAKCGIDGDICKIPANAGTITVYYGANGKFATAQGSGDFTCLPKGWQKDKNKPADLGVDLASKEQVTHTCYVPNNALAGGSPPVSPPANATVDLTNFAACVTDGQRCANATGNWNGYYGVASGKLVPISGFGPFTCLPGDLKVADPVPGAQKTCYVNKQNLAAQTPPPAPPSGGTPALVAGCDAYKGTIYNATVKQYTTMAALNGNYYKNQALNSTSPQDAATECAKACAALGPNTPAPCAWFSVTKWLNTITATNKDSIGYQCHLFNDRNLKQITTPKLPVGDNLGTASNPARFQEATSYACRV